MLNIPTLIYAKNATSSSASDEGAVEAVCRSAELSASSRTERRSAKEEMLKCEKTYSKEEQLY